VEETIGPVTARAARKLGLRVDIEAPEHTVEGLLRILSASSSKQISEEKQNW